MAKIREPKVKTLAGSNNFITNEAKANLARSNQKSDSFLSSYEDRCVFAIILATQKVYQKFEEKIVSVIFVRKSQHQVIISVRICQGICFVFV